MLMTNSRRWFTVRVCCSADFQSALSQNCILQVVRKFERPGRLGRMPIANRRYSRLKVSATTKATALNTHLPIICTGCP